MSIKEVIAESIPWPSLVVRWWVALLGAALWIAIWFLSGSFTCSALCRTNVVVSLQSNSIELITSDTWQLQRSMPSANGQLEIVDAKFAANFVDNSGLEKVTEIRTDPSDENLIGVAAISELRAGRGTQLNLDVLGPTRVFLSIKGSMSGSGEIAGPTTVTLNKNASNPHAFLLKKDERQYFNFEREPQQFTHTQIKLTRNNLLSYEFTPLEASSVKFERNYNQGKIDFGIESGEITLVDYSKQKRELASGAGVRLTNFTGRFDELSLKADASTLNVRLTGKVKSIEVAAMPLTNRTRDWVNMTPSVRDWINENQFLAWLSTLVWVLLSFKRKKPEKDTEQTNT